MLLGRPTRRLAPATLLLAGVLAASGCAGGAAGGNTLRPGQTRTFAHARAGETIVCLGKDGSIRLSVPRQPADANVSRVAFDRTLSLTIGSLQPLSPVHHGGVTATCKGR